MLNVCMLSIFNLHLNLLWLFIREMWYINSNCKLDRFVVMERIVFCNETVLPFQGFHANIIIILTREKGRERPSISYPLFKIACFVTKVISIFNKKMSWSKLVNPRRPSELSVTKRSLVKHKIWPLVLTSLDQLIFTLNILFTFVTKQTTSMRRSAVLSLPLYLMFRG